MQRCKFCGSKMELMEEDFTYLYYVCMNDNCDWTLTEEEGFEDEWEKVY